MFNPLRWFEKTVVTGEVVHDYGPICESARGTFGKVIETHTLLLCRKAKKDLIVLRHFRRTSLAFSLSYTQIPAENAEKLIAMLVDLAARRGTPVDSQSK